MESLTYTALSVLGLYLLAGVIFAVAFVLRGAAAIDPSAKEGTWGFKLLIFPASVALWPLLAKRWLSGQTTPPQEKSPHRCACRGSCPGKGEAA